jgi:hypothetical protein
MPGITPDEGESLIARILYRRDLGDRDAGLRLGLFTNVTIGEATALASVTEPVGTGYGRVTLTDGNWTVTGDTASYPQQVFTAGAGGWAPEVQGYFICTQAASGTPRLLHIELDSFQLATSITRSGSTATCTTPLAHGFNVGDRINIRGANQAEYNGIFVLTAVPTSTTFTFTVAGSPATPATGTISVNRCYLMNANDTYAVDLSNLVQ